ncbi:MAG TPA: Gfo/Idh/MocA family oxidoreductase [Phycisphaerae bacterium]|nr:Gfo/Idh/MocA family oxidoreductase [Phycisphaerae bacterium]HNU46867.1 Gfo/Idh/MocA family oxidoreductase [Phycisphaerae bacterium]
MNRLRTALLGLSGAGADYLQALRADEQFELVAIGDPDVELLRRVVQGTGARGYEDLRSLIVEQSREPLQALVVALEPPASPELLLIAAQRGLPVFLKPPAARTFAELAKLTAGFAAAGCPLIVARPWSAEPAFALLREPGAGVGHLCHATAQIRVPLPPLAGWAGDAARAGGGVLLHGAYELIDLLVGTLGVPAQLWAQRSLAVPPGMPRSYDTEDAVVVGMVLPGGATAALSACRASEVRTAHWSLRLLGSAGSLDVSPSGLLVESVEPGHGTSVPVHTTKPIAPALGAFGAALRAGITPTESAAAAHLPTLAVIETAYLSARTGAPETPARLLR